MPTVIEISSEPSSDEGSSLGLGETCSDDSVELVEPGQKTGEGASSQNAPSVEADSTSRIYVDKDRAGGRVCAQTNPHVKKSGRYNLQSSDSEPAAGDSSSKRTAPANRYKIEGGGYDLKSSDSEPAAGGSSSKHPPPAKERKADKKPKKQRGSPEHKKPKTSVSAKIKSLLRNMIKTADLLTVTPRLCKEHLKKSFEDGDAVCEKHKKLIRATINREVVRRRR